MVLAHCLYKSINDKKHSHFEKKLWKHLRLLFHLLGRGSIFLAFKWKLNLYFFTKILVLYFNTALVDDDDFVDGKNKTEVIIFMSL